MVVCDSNSSCSVDTSSEVDADLVAVDVPGIDSSDAPLGSPQELFVVSPAPVPAPALADDQNKIMQAGQNKFDIQPKWGFEHLIKNKVLLKCTTDITGLNKTVIGNCLGELDEQTFHEFVYLHEFKDLTLVEAFKKFLWSFRLPKEAKPINSNLLIRLVDKFAQRYCELNPSICKSQGLCAELTIAIISLNHSLHNPASQQRPKKMVIKLLHASIKHGNKKMKGNKENVPKTLLENLYDSVKAEPIKIPEGTGNDGLLHKFVNFDRVASQIKQVVKYKKSKRC